MNNSAFVSSNGCLEPLFFFFFFVFRYSRSSLRDSVPDRVDLLESIESFSSTFLFRRPVGYVREPVTSTDYVYARLWLGYANVFPRKIASFVSHLRHADASICPTPSKSFHSDFYPSIHIRNTTKYIYIYIYSDYVIIRLLNPMSSSYFNKLSSFSFLYIYYFILLFYIILYI